MTTVALASEAAHARKYVIALVVTLLALAAPAVAQSATRRASDDRAFEIRVITGGFVARGDLRDDISDAGWFGGQLGWHVERHWIVTGTYGWAPAGARAFVTNRRVDVIQNDVGLEGRLPDLVQMGISKLAVFLGSGLGARTYRVRQGGGSDTQFDAYLSLGADLSRESSRFTLRTEVRDYQSSYRGVAGTIPETARADLAMFAGVGYRF